MEPSPRPLLLTAPLLAVVLMLFILLMSNLIPAQTSQWTLLSVAVYFAVMVPMLSVYISRSIRASRLKKDLSTFSSGLLDTVQNVSDLPYFLLDPADGGTVKMMSSAMRRLIDIRSWTHNFPLSDLSTTSARHIFASAVCSREDMLNSFRNDYARLFPDEPDPEKELSEAERQNDDFANALRAAGKDPRMGLPISSSRFLMHATPLRANERPYCLVWLDDMTDYVNRFAKDEREYPIIAYIYLDNLEELAQYVGVTARSASSKIEEELNKWATEIDGLLREYDTDRYLLVFPKEKLQGLLDSGFDILERVHALELGDKSVPATISIGLASTVGSLPDRSRDALFALDMALQRGGDQAVLRAPADDGGTRYFGGRNKSMEKDISRSLRVTSQVLCQRIRTAENILIMGHKNPDYDALASCIGVARMAMCVKGSPDSIHIVSDMGNPEFNQFREALSGLHEYDNIFIASDASTEFIRPDTLLIVCDVNNVNITESRDLIPAATWVVFIDHHTRQAEFNFTPVIEMIQPQASSASELVACMLMQSPYYDKLTKEEATLLLAGIMLDTKNFVNSTGWQTFEAAQYLYTRNAHTDKARAYFRETMDDIVVSGQFDRLSRTYRGCIAVTWQVFRRQLNSADKIAASKAADKLLTADNIRASFAIVYADNGVVISGRSSDPTINVGTILRDLGGGGHFDSAGTQLPRTSVGDVAAQLRTAIDKYMDGTRATKTNS